jgi:uncharacterized protein YecE (DUF72 family)
MEFGRVIPKLLTKIDHSLPPDAQRTDRILHANTIVNNTMYFGCAKWGKQDWMSLLYPSGTKEKEFLEHYAGNFSCIELNTTFYRIYPAETISDWVKRTPDIFLFLPKFYQGITHHRRLKNCEDLTMLFLDSISHFKGKLGPAFLQLPENFHPKNFAILESYLEHLPDDLKLFVEVRHPLWYSEPYRSAFFNLLERRGYGAVITDTSGRRDMLHMELTNPHVFIRFVGNNIHHTDIFRINDWIMRMKHWRENGIENIYFMMHQHDESNTPVISRDMIERLNSELGTNIIIPQLIDGEKLKRSHRALRRAIAFQSKRVSRL